MSLLYNVTKCIEKNISKYDNSKFDSKRTGYIKNVMITAYKKYYNRSLTIDDFFKKSFEVIFDKIKTESERVTSSYFTSPTKCEVLIAMIELSLLRYQVSNLKEHTV